jgi:crotonobetainyl-CoA:carnitine CoA-transferase CaiB-like acyl-CoA transferase
MTLLEGVRVVDLTDGPANLCSRLLADLGAEVVLVEPPGGNALRRSAPVVDGVSLRFAMYNANKKGVALDLASEIDLISLVEMLIGADIVIDGGALAGAGLSAELLRARQPGLVVVSVSDFGPEGPAASERASAASLLARAAVLVRSGPPGLGEPLLPPTDLVDAVVAAHVCWAALVAFYSRVETGAGSEVDVTRFDAVLQLFDPVFGTGGTAGAGKNWHVFPPGRPDARVLYPVFPCRDGQVRITVLAPRQWHGLRSWLGDPEEFMDPKYDLVFNRFMAAGELYPLIGELFAASDAMELVAEGQRRGVPIAPVLAPAAVLQADHYRERGAISSVEVAPGVTASVPTGCFEVDGKRAGFVERAPEVGEHNSTAGFPPRSADAATVPMHPRGPLAGLRVLDLGVIVLGAEAGRLFADMGAEVIKVESRAFPDAGRTAAGTEMTPSFAWGNRNKLGLGLNLRDPDGIAIFRELVERSDLILANFKPGTLDSLGLDFAALTALNPRIVASYSSALGSSGPWRGWMGYGPLVRAAAGLTSCWRFPDDPESIGDHSTVFPDHFAARITAIGALAGLIDSRRNGQPHLVESAQAETILSAFAARYAEESLRPGAFTPEANAGSDDTMCFVTECQGEDGWCVATVAADDAATIERLRELVGAAGDDRDALRAAITDWTKPQPPPDAATRLRAIGVIAEPMAIPTAVATDPQNVARDWWRTLIQPGVGEPLPTEARPFRSPEMPALPMRPAPFHGEHTRDICSRILELDDAEIDRLIAGGALEVPDPWRPLAR